MRRIARFLQDALGRPGQVTLLHDMAQSGEIAKARSLLDLLAAGAVAS